MIKNMVLVLCGLFLATSAFASSYECYYVCGSTFGGMTSGYIAISAATVADANVQMTNWANNQGLCTAGGCLVSDPQIQNNLISFRRGETRTPVKRNCK